MGHFIMFELNLVNVITSKLNNNACPYYLNEVLLIESKSSFPNLKNLFSKLTLGAKAFYTMIGPYYMEKSN